MGFVLALFQIAAQERFVGMIKCCLRALRVTTGQPAGNDETYWNNGG
jgi:hypothetical protein